MSDRGIKLRDRTYQGGISVAVIKLWRKQTPFVASWVISSMVRETFLE